MIERFVYNGEFPKDFFGFIPPIYEKLNYQPDENIDATEHLFKIKKDEYEIIFYTVQNKLRLVGIFPFNTHEAFFGYWETVNELELNKAAFGRLEKDALARGKKKLTGPMHFNTFHRYRLRLNDPSWGMFDREAINPVYYPSILEQLDFKVKYEYESRLIKSSEIPILYKDKQLFLDSIKEFSFDMIPLNAQSWKENEDKIFNLIHDIFSQNAAYKPISRVEFQLMYNQKFADKICPFTSVLFSDRQTGALAAMSICQPNYYSLKADYPDYHFVFGDDYPWLAKKTLLVKSVGVHPKFRNQRLMTYLGIYAMMSFRNYYEEVIFCLMKSDNFSTQFSDGLPYEKADYALFEKELR